MVLWDLRGHHVITETCFKVYSKPAQSNFQHDNLLSDPFDMMLPSVSWS